ncbi:hypothetical protein HRbin33_01082 [bacterium HR33]|nr:hypothetical protein HRbin33_01082 [bacterium HR33]
MKVHEDEQKITQCYFKQTGDVANVSLLINRRPDIVYGTAAKRYPLSKITAVRIIFNRSWLRGVLGGVRFLARLAVLSKSIPVRVVTLAIIFTLGCTDYDRSSERAPRTQTLHHGPLPVDAPDWADSPARPLVEEADSIAAASTPESLDRALALLQRALKLDPDFQPALDRLVLFYLTRAEQSGDIPAAYDSAAVYARRMNELDPVRGGYLLGRVYWMRGEHRLAEEAFQSSLAADPTYWPSIHFLGYLYFDLGQHDLGIPLQRRAAAMNPNNRSTRLLYGFSYFHLGLPDLAVQPFEEALALSRDTYTLGGQLALYMIRGDYAGAIAYLDSIWRLEPEAAYTWARLGEAHFMAGNADEAERYLKGALERDPTVTCLYTWKSVALPLAYLYVKSGRAQQAEPLIAHAYAHADQLLNIGQEPWNAYYQYAALALLEGDRGGAIRWLRATHLAGMPAPVLIREDPLLRDLHGDPEFEEIVQRLEWRGAELRRRLGAAQTEHP